MNLRADSKKVKFCDIVLYICANEHPLISQQSFKDAPNVKYEHKNDARPLSGGQRRPHLVREGRLRQPQVRGLSVLSEDFHGPHDEG